MAVRDKMKGIWMKGMSAVGNTAANIATSTRHKMDEVTLQNRRKEVMASVSNTAYALWQKGEELPAPLAELLEELLKVDNKLADLRAAKYAAPETAAEPPEEAQEETEEAAEEETQAEEKPAEAAGKPEETEQPETPDAEPDLTPEETVPIPVFPDSPVESRINGFFNEGSSVGKMAEKVNSSLDQLSERIRSFPAKAETPAGDETDTTMTGTEGTE